MSIKRFFGSRARDAPPNELDAAAAPSPESDDDAGDAEAIPEEAPERSWRDRAEAVLPTGASTGSKRLEALFGSADADGPTHFVSARGCRVIDTGGANYLDCTMALGAVALGYAEPRVTQAVIEAAAQGNVAALSSWREVELAERLCALIPCAERAQFLKTGFRLAPGGYQEVCGVTPALASFGKAMANGYPLAAVVGKAPLMDAARRTWISSTLASESTALAAALAVLDWHDTADICATLAETGREMRGAVDRAIAASGLTGVHTDGVDAMWLVRWDVPARESRFLVHAASEGVLLKRGAYNFAAVAHDEVAIQEIEAAASAALVTLAEEER